MDASINSDDQEYESSDLDESFSFTCCHFNANEGGSGGGVDDEDEDEDEDEDDESYIEIALESLPTYKDGDNDNRDVKLRVSFSSSRLPLTELFVDQVSTDQLFVSSDASSSSSSGDREAELISSGVSGANPKGNSMRRLQFSAVNRVLNAFVSTLRVPSPGETGRIDRNRRLPSSETRKASKVTTVINGGITRMMIKLRSMKIRAALASIVKPGQVKGKPKQIMTSSSSSSTSSSIWIHQTKLFDCPTERDGRRRRKTSGGLEITKMEAIRGVLEAISSMSSGGSWRKQRNGTKTKSCPGSIKCSPINERGGVGVGDRESSNSSRDNAVQAAIAHCKRSFGQAQDFSF